eukprot:366387-Chlamydomonas_euryale.AAC.18
MLLHQCHPARMPPMRVDALHALGRLACPYMHAACACAYMPPLHADAAHVCGRCPIPVDATPCMWMLPLMHVGDASCMWTLAHAC